MMEKITVSFDYGAALETVAVFSRESLYMSCLPALEREAKEVGAELVESVEEV